jgi:hypothetical protein
VGVTRGLAGEKFSESIKKKGLILFIIINKKMIILALTMSLKMKYG